MKATIKDVGRKAGVSFKTVSRVINREPSVSEELREPVWEAIESLNYQPNMSARQLRRAASFIAHIYDNPNSHCVIEMLHGILAQCKRNGFEPRSRLTVPVPQQLSIVGFEGSPAADQVFQSQLVVRDSTGRRFL